MGRVRGERDGNAPEAMDWNLDEALNVQADGFDE
jgi:hypothetical protein